jgi:hypothetical protein
MRARSGANPFLTGSGRPLLVRCAVLFIDLLGVREMNMSQSAASHLVGLHSAVGVMHRDFFSEPSRYRSAFFSDTLVLATPIVRETDDATEVRALVRHARWLQNDLVAEGFFVRGGLSLGSLHFSDQVLFGPALVEAYDLESSAAVHPRIVLSQAAAESQRGKAGGSTLLRDDDGHAFIDYLGAAVNNPHDPVPLLQGHRDTVVSRLHGSRRHKRHWEKHRWLAEYHNAVVSQRLPKARELLVDLSTMTWQFSPFE